MTFLKNKTLLLFFHLFFLSHSLFSAVETHTLCILFDAGETTSLLPMLKKWESEKRDFFVLVMGTAEKLLKNEEFNGKKLTLQDFGCSQIIDSSTVRTAVLSLENVLLIQQNIHPDIVLVGVASQIQKQILEAYPSSFKVAYIDNFNYDPHSESYDTVKKVQEAADLILCPSKHVAGLFDTGNGKLYASVGKPSLEQWKNKMSAVNRDEIYSHLGLNLHDGPVVAFVGGYGYGYDVINPLFREYAKKLQEYGYQSIILDHPKIAISPVGITAVLAISEFIVGYNSSVIFDSAILGKKALYVVPTEIPFSHFAIEKGLLPRARDFNELLDLIRSYQSPPNLQSEDIPLNSLQLINEAIFSNYGQSGLDGRNGQLSENNLALIL